MIAIAASMERWAEQGRDSQTGVGRKSSAPCPLCRGSRWVKTYTPWGCPASAPCPRCNSASGRHREAS